MFACVHTHGQTEMTPVFWRLQMNFQGSDWWNMGKCFFHVVRHSLTENKRVINVCSVCIEKYIM